MDHKRAIFVMAQKGGVGKTFFTRGLTQVYRDAGLRTAIYDCDPKVGQLLQYHAQRTADGGVVEDQDPTVGAAAFDVRSDRERDGLANAIHTDAEVIIMDMPGGTVGEIERVYGTPKGLFLEYAKHGYEVIVVVIVDVLKASTATVLDAVELFGDTAHYVVVKNGGSGGAPRPDDFRMYDGYDDGETRSRGLARKAVEAAGGETIYMEGMAAGTIQWLDEFDYSFGAGRAHERALGHSGRCSYWLQAFEQTLASTRLAVAPEDAKVARSQRKAS